MDPQLRHGGVEGLERPGCLGLHDTALHDAEDESGERPSIGLRRQPVPGRLQPRLHPSDPLREVERDLGPCLRVAARHLQCEIADRAPLGAAGHEKTAPVHLQQCEHAPDRIVHRALRRIQHRLREQPDVSLQDADQQGPLAGEEVVQAAAVDLRRPEDRGHRRGFVTLLVEQPGRHFEDTLSGLSAHVF